MSETIKPPQERTHADYGVGSYLLAVTRTITDNPPADSPDLLPNAEIPLKKVDRWEQMEKRWAFLNEIADNDA
ncbi:MAG: hypothetical protein NUV98_05185 [Candidatus Roizmanbacteria bacterium]|nr:hypothetical protein [Candidatus Roizmanbacteria bacterium]